jgi:hypothetical protein
MTARTPSPQRTALLVAALAVAMGHNSNVRVSELETGLVSVTGPVARVLDYVELHGPIRSGPSAEA